MHHNQTTRLQAAAQKHEAILILRVVRIVNQAAAFVRKDSLGLLKRDTVLGEVGTRLAPIPGKLNIAHSIMIAISSWIYPHQNRWIRILALIQYVYDGQTHAERGPGGCLPSEALCQVAGSIGLAPVEVYLASISEQPAAADLPPLAASLRGALKKADTAAYRKHLVRKYF